MEGLNTLNNKLSTAIRGRVAAGLLPSQLASFYGKYPDSDPLELLEKSPLKGRTIELDRRFICRGEPDFPSRLEDSVPFGAPWWLWVQGQREVMSNAYTVGIVGTRRPSIDGINIAKNMASFLSERGITVVSGLAKGIDQAAHRGALAGGGDTIAVIATGLGFHYPRGSEGLSNEISNHGCVVTEMPPNYPINNPAQFLHRNRIIVALSDVLVVIEAGERSGALNSAGWAAEFNKECAVVPSSPNNYKAKGSLALLRDGCQLVRNGADILELLGLPSNYIHQKTKAVNLSDMAQSVLSLLSTTPASLDRICVESNISIPTLMTVLGELTECQLVEVTSDGLVISS